MSLTAMLWVLEHSEATGGGRLVLIALADYAHDDGSKAFPAIETLARRARMSRKGTQGALRRLEAEGHIEQTGVTRSGTRVYRIRGVASSPLSDEGANVVRPGGEPDALASGERRSPDPLTTTEPSGIKGEPIGFAEWLAHHGEVTGQPVPGVSKARAKLAEKFGVLLGEGRSLADLKLASVGAQADKWLRENDKTFPRNVLVYERVDELIAKGRKAPAAADPSRWTKRSRPSEDGQL